MKRVALGLWLVTAFGSSVQAAYDACGVASEEARARWEQLRIETRQETDAVERQRDLGTLASVATLELSALGATVEVFAPEGASSVVSTVRSFVAEFDRNLQETATTLPYSGREPESLPAPPTLTILLGDYDSDINEAVQWCTTETDCQIVLFRNFWQGGATALQFTMAHELYHVVQSLIWPGVNQCESFWWVEGTAEWFANRVVPGQTYSSPFLERFDLNSHDSPLTNLHYGATPFWFWVDANYDAGIPMTFGGFGNAGLDNPTSVGEELPPDAWRDFLETYLSGELRYPDGRRAIPDPDLGELRSEPWVLTGPPLSFPRVQMELGPGEWEIKTEASVDSVSFNDNSSWFQLATGSGAAPTFSHQVECPDPSVLLMAAVSLDGTDLEVSASIEDGEADSCRCLEFEPIPEGHCMVGAWGAMSTDAPEVYNEAQDAIEGRSRWTGQNMGNSSFVFQADGTFAQMTEGAESKFTRQDGDVTMHQTVNITNTTRGRWMSVGTDKLEICIESFEGQMTNKISIDGRVRRSGPFPIPYDPGTEGNVAEYWFTCDRILAELRQLVDGTEIVTWKGKRVAE